MSAEHQGERDWLAFRYVAGEMTAQEASALELRLADDQEAREAVCRAVGLAQQLADARPPDRDYTRSVGSARAPVTRGIISLHGRVARAVGWMAAGAAAATLAFWLARSSGPGSMEPSLKSSGTPEAARAGPVERVYDAEAWGLLQASDAWAAHTERWLFEAKSPIANDSPDPRSPPSVPPWLLAAAAGSNLGEKP
jgi:Trp operon repressor